MFGTFLVCYVLTKAFVNALVNFPWFLFMLGSD
uniref:Uncharacterized protein n=1 Tax=Rhizophora mucronata TaxID=61149 RepID=A0A2P2N4A2_RHIMU